MNKREKRLLLATGAVLVVGVGTLLLGGDDSPKKKEASPPALAHAATDTATRGSDQAATAWIIDRGALDTLLARASLPLTELTRNPFQWATQPQQPPPTGQPTPAPETVAVGSLKVAGVFISGGTRGALVNGEVWFVGESHGPYRLVTVGDRAVTIAVGNEEWEIIIDRGRIDGEDNASHK